MTAMEKVAWTELMVSVGAAVVAVSLIPWLGSGAAGAFGLLGLLMCSVWFLRRRGSRVVVDERDLAIERLAMRRGIETAWMATFVTLIALVLWSSLFNESMVATRYLNWLIWIQFAICYGVKGFVGVISYRSPSRGA